MTGAMGDDETFKVEAQESQVAEQVEYLVACTLIRKAQRVPDRSLAAEDQEIGRGRSEADARCTKSIRLCLGDKCAAGSELLLEYFRRQAHAIAVSLDRCIRTVIKMVGQGEGPCGAGVGRESSISVADNHRAFELKDLAHPVLFDHAGLLERLDECATGAIAARALGRVDLNDAIVDAHTSQGGQDMFSHFNDGVALLDRGAALRAETTRSIRAGTDGRSGKSIRSKTTPVPGSAGRKRSVTSDPWKNPCPRTTAAWASVRSGA